MSFLDPTTLRAAAGTANEPKEVSTALESLLVKQMITSSGMFKSHGSGAGGSIRSELFAETLADAVAHSGQLNLASSVQQQLQKAIPSTGVQPPLPHQASQAHLSSPLADASAHLTSSFGNRVNPIDGSVRKHSGIDIAAKTGTPILAAQSGVVVSAGSRGGYGQAVEINHGSGMSTLYAHASQLLVHPGDHVTQGQEIATVGQTGRATGPHLHFEVRQGGQALNPTRALSAYSQRADGSGKKRGLP